MVHILMRVDESVRYELSNTQATLINSHATLVWELRKLPYKLSLLNSDSRLTGALLWIDGTIAVAAAASDHARVLNLLHLIRAIVKMTLYVLYLLCLVKYSRVSLETNTFAWGTMLMLFWDFFSDVVYFNLAKFARFAMLGSLAFSIW
jgi:hypothetical protein